MTVAFELNGRPVTVTQRHPHLLAALREELGVTSAKDGCSPQGQCGCCTVMIDGKAQISCTYPLDKVAGRSVTTLDGVDESERQRYADAFAACGGLQCGFCIPGMIMAARALLDEFPEPTLDQIKYGLGGNLCRCTGYTKIFEAVLKAAQMERV